MQIPKSPRVAVYSGDQFGFYTVGTFQTYSKLLAIEESRRTGIGLEWHFNDLIYDAHDWRREPARTLRELYRIRAQEIRDQYDYIVLWYSGGADSRCMLDAFLDNDIHIDEIAHFVGYEADKDKHSVLNEEIFFNALPHVEQIRESCPHTQHRVVDISRIIKEMYLRPDVKFDHIYHIKGIMSANSLARSYIREYVPEYQDIMHSGRRMCFLWGAEKPRILQLDGKWHTCLLDVFSETNLRLQSLADQGYFDEWFYWAPSTAEMICKQSHILMRTMQAAEQDRSLLSDQTGAHLPRAASGQYLRNDIYHSAIYPGWRGDLIVAPKPKNLLLSERDNWFWNRGPESEPAVQVAMSGIKELLSRVGPDWINDASDLTRGIKACRRCYALE